MQTRASGNIWPKSRREAEIYVNAYKTVEDHIRGEIEIRRFVKEKRDAHKN